MVVTSTVVLINVVDDKGAVVMPVVVSVLVVVVHELVVKVVALDEAVDVVCVVSFVVF